MKAWGLCLYDTAMHRDVITVHCSPAGRLSIIASGTYLGAGCCRLSGLHEQGQKHMVRSTAACFHKRKVYWHTDMSVICLLSMSLFELQWLSWVCCNRDQALTRLKDLLCPFNKKFTNPRSRVSTGHRWDLISQRTEYVTTASKEYKLEEPCPWDRHCLRNNGLWNRLLLTS